MSRRAFFLCLVAVSMLPVIAFSQSFLSQYKGLPYHDSRYGRRTKNTGTSIECLL